MFPQLRARAAAFLTDTCTIEREEIVTSEFGTPSRVYAMVAHDVACRVIKAGYSSTSAAQMAAGQDVLDETYKLALLPTQTIDINHRVTVGGVVYQVVRLETALTDAFFRHAIIARKRGMAD